MNNEMKNLNVNNMNIQPKKKKNIPLIIGLSVVGVFILAIVTLFLIFSIEENQDKVWKSGVVQILGNEIKLPCKVDEFESILNTKIITKETSEDIKAVKIRLKNNDVLLFDVYVENDMITGIMLDAYRSNENESFKVDPNESYAIESERDAAINIVFPGNITIESSIEEVKNLYSTKPFNSSYVYSDEEIGYSDDKYISARHCFSNSEWKIAIHTADNEITGIDYYYKGDL